MMSDSETKNSIEQQPLDSADADVRHGRRRCGYFQNQKKYLVILVIILCTLAGFLFGYFIHREKISGQTRVPRIPHDAYQAMVDSKRLEENLRYFSRRPHAAGSPRQLELAKYLANLWTSYGFDEVKMPEYKVMLSHPQKDKPNVVKLIENGKVQYEIIGKINVTADPSESTTFQHTPYLAYSSSGVVEGELVYANNGRQKDFEILKAQNISIKGKVVMFRIISGDVLLAAKYGAIGAVLYPDPSYYSREGQSDEDTYPNKVWSSRKSIYEKPLRSMFGDPLTPGLPALPGMYRRSLNETDLPSIPSQPISYEDAMYLLSRMNGSQVPEDWRGNLNLTYRFGPGFKSANTTIRIEVHNQVQQTNIYNVIGTVRGREEPDRIVLIGNHRDAWLFGAVDPSSGTATLAEMSRIVGNLLKTGWKPRRTIKFCSWAAEEFGLIGSVEWVEQNSKLLSDRAIAYLNTDVAVGGNFVLVVQTCPLLVDFIFSWTKKVRDPNAHGSNTSMYDIMTERYPSEKNPGEPKVLPFRFMSDYYPFYNDVGVPSADFSYFFGYKQKMSLYPVYHTQHDTFYWVKKFVVPQFKFHEAMAKLQGGMLLDLADLPLLPYDVQRLSNSLKDILNTRHFLNFKKKNLYTDHIVRAVYKFTNASQEFVKAKSMLTGKESPLVRRRYNDQMVQVEKAFIRSALFSRDPVNKHVVSGGMFRGVMEALVIAKKNGNYNEVNKQLSIVAEAIASAADIIKPLKGSALGLVPSFALHIFTFTSFILIVFCKN